MDQGMMKWSERDIHKHNGEGLLCGHSRYYEDGPELPTRHSKKWSEVTCKDCLARRSEVVVGDLYLSLLKEARRGSMPPMEMPLKINVDTEPGREMMVRKIYYGDDGEGAEEVRIEIGVV